MLATASAQVCVPLGHSSLYFWNVLTELQQIKEKYLGFQIETFIDWLKYCIYIHISLKYQASNVRELSEHTISQKTQRLDKQQLMNKHAILLHAT